MKLRLKLGLALMMVLSLLGCASSPTPQITPAVPLPTEETITVQEDGWYSTKEEVVEYLEAYGHLPENYITKKEAQALGWDNAKGNLWDVAEGKSIGGDRFDAVITAHPHLICTRCGGVFDLNLDISQLLQSAKGVEGSFQVEDCKVLVQGVCEDCLKKEE